MSEAFVIHGGKPLEGEIKVSGSKNAILALLAASLLSREKITLENVPAIRDVEVILEIMHGLGSKVERRDHTLIIDNSDLKNAEPNPALVRKLRGSVLLIGPLLARFGKVKIPYPGGDVIGARPIDIHLDGLRRLGAEMKESNTDLEITAPKLAGTKIVLRIPSVTGTENLLMAAATAQGETVIKVAAAEPYVEDLANLLIKMGANIQGAGTSTLRINGVSQLHGATHRVIPDQIEVGTFACLAAATRSNLLIQDIEPEHLDAVFLQMELMGVNFEVRDKSLHIKPPQGLYRAIPITAGYHPNFPTDLQPLFAVLATQAEGTTLLHDPIFEGRLGYINELVKMGANAIIADPHRALITGPTPLRGAELRSLDIRAGMTVIIAGLVAEGETVINGAEIIDRGYENIEKRLQALGADITRIKAST